MRDVIYINFQKKNSIKNFVSFFHVIDILIKISCFPYDFFLSDLTVHIVRYSYYFVNSIVSCIEKKEINKQKTFTHFSLYLLKIKRKEHYVS